MEYLQKANSFVSIDERLSGSFTYDHYIRGLRQLIRWLAYSQGVGNVKKTKLDVERPNESLLLVLTGHSNRSAIRYEGISRLLEECSDTTKRSNKELTKSDYFKYLFRRHENLSKIGRYKGRRECLIKVRRTLDLYDFFVRNGADFAGFTKGNGEACVKDYPLCFSFSSMSDEILELDGSHRRSVAYFCGAREIASHIVDISDLDDWFSINGSESMYFFRHWDKFKNISMQISKI